MGGADRSDPGRIPDIYGPRLPDRHLLGRPGPVVLVLPEDMLRLNRPRPSTQHLIARSGFPAPADTWEKLRAALAGGRSHDRRRQHLERSGGLALDITAFAEADPQSPSLFRAQDHFDNSLILAMSAMSASGRIPSKLAARIEE